MAQPHRWHVPDCVVRIDDQGGRVMSGLYVTTTVQKGAPSVCMRAVVRPSGKFRTPALQGQRKADFFGQLVINTQAELPAPRAAHSSTKSADPVQDGCASGGWYGHVRMRGERSPGSAIPAAARIWTVPRNGQRTRQVVSRRR